MHGARANGSVDLPVTPLPMLMSLCLIESSAGVFIPQSFMSISKVSDLKLCSAICPHYCFGLLFFLVAHLGGCQSQHIVEAHSADTVIDMALGDDEKPTSAGLLLEKDKLQ